MAIRDLPDMYAPSPRPQAYGPWAYISGKSPMAMFTHQANTPWPCLHIRQIPHGHVTTITYTYDYT